MEGNFVPLARNLPATHNPRGNFWIKDETSIGRRMMESMGWSPGKGLGANDDGCVEPIAFKTKKDLKGVGCKIGDDDWIAHQDDFNALLSQLNGGKTFTDEDCKPQRLEEKSKQSKRKVHYKKFARWKDLSCRSEQDIASILGKRQRKKDNEIKLNENQDMKLYFAQKMAEKRAKAYQSESNSDSSFAQPMAKKSKLKVVSFNEELNNVVEISDSTQETEGDVLSKKSKKKKKKKNKNKRKCLEEDGEIEDSKVESLEQNLKEEINDEKEVKENGVETSSEIEENDVMKSKKQKKKRKKHRKDEDQLETNENDGVDREKQKKKKEKVKKHKEDDGEDKDAKILCEASSDNCTETEGNDDEESVAERKREKRKKRKSKKGDGTAVSCGMLGSINSIISRDPEKKGSVQTLVDSMKMISMFEGSNFFSIKGYDGSLEDN